jgi:hypothetical protein
VLKIDVRFCSLTPAAGLGLPVRWWLAGFGFLAVAVSEKLATASEVRYIAIFNNGSTTGPSGAAWSRA